MMITQASQYVTWYLIELVCKLTDNLPQVLITDIEELWSWHAIEGGTSSNGVSSHVSKVHPLANFQLWQSALMDETVQAITGWTPDRGREPVWGVLGTRQRKAIY